MKKIIVGSIITFLICSCTKHPGVTVQDDIGPAQSIYLRGRLLLFDTLSGAYSYANGQPYPSLANKVVNVTYLSTASGADVNFFDTTDSNGYFQFTNLKAGTRYVVSSVDTGSTGLIYQAADTVSGSLPGIDSLLLIATPSPANTGAIFYFTDPTSSGPIPGVNVCVFKNPTLPAKPDTSCRGSSYYATSNQLGKALIIVTTPGTYYPQFNAMFPAFQFNLLDTVQFTSPITRYTILVN